VESSYADATQADRNSTWSLGGMGVGCIWGLKFSFWDWSHPAYMELMDRKGMDGERAADNFRVGYANYGGSRRRVSIYHDACINSEAGSLMFRCCEGEGNHYKVWMPIADLSDDD